CAARGRRRIAGRCELPVDATLEALDLDHVLEARVRATQLRENAACAAQLRGSAEALACERLPVERMRAILRARVAAVRADAAVQCRGLARIAVVERCACCTPHGVRRILREPRRGRRSAHCGFGMCDGTRLGFY